MNIETITLHHISMLLVAPFETSFGRETDRQCIIVTLQAEGLTGYGECVASREPGYNYETTGTAMHILKDFIAPNAATGTVLADASLDIKAAAYVNGGLVASRGDARLEAANLLYRPVDAPLVAFGTLRLEVAGVAVDAGQTWVSPAMNTQWTGLLTNYGRVLMAGNARGQVYNLATDVAQGVAEPDLLNGSYLLMELPSLKGAYIDSHTDVARRAEFVVEGVFEGSLRNVASDAQVSGTYAYSAEGHWILYNLGHTYALGGSYWWNNNEKDALQNGVKRMAIDVSDDGVVWTTLTEFELPIASGKPTYEGTEGPDLQGVETKYILLTALENHGGSCYSFGEMKKNVDYISSTNDDKNLAYCMDVKAYPNSFIVNTQIDISSNCGQSVSVKIYDVFGRQIGESYHQIAAKRNLLHFMAHNCQLECTS